DATAVPLDYDVAIPGTHADPTTPALEAAPRALAGRPAIDIARRPTTQAALAEWRRYMVEKDAPLTPRPRTPPARRVAAVLGAGGFGCGRGRGAGVAGFGAGGAALPAEPAAEPVPSISISVVGGGVVSMPPNVTSVPGAAAASGHSIATPFASAVATTHDSF